MATLTYEYIVQGSQFVVNTPTPNNDDYDPHVAARDDGGFVITWTMAYPPVGGTINTSVFAKVYNASGVAFANDQLIGSDVVGAELNSEPIVFGDGRTAVLTQNSLGGYFTQMLGTNGVLQGGAIGSGGREIAELGFNTAVLIGPNGGATTTSIEGRIMTETSSATTPTIGSSFVIAPAFSGLYASVDAAPLGGGSSVYVWDQDAGQVGTTEWLRIFNGTTPVTNPIQIANAGNMGTTLESIVVTAIPQGFAVAWVQSGGSVMLRTYTGGGVPLSAPVQVNATPITANVNGGIVADPSITTLSDGTIVVAWQQENTKYSARLFNSSAQPLSNETWFGSEGSTYLYHSFGDIAALSGNGTNIPGNRTLFTVTSPDIQAVILQWVRKLTGDASSEYIEGSIYPDRLLGMGGNDTLEGGASFDTLDGGDGFDLASYFFSGQAITASLVTGGSSGDATGDVYVSIEGLIGSGLADALTGDSGANHLDGRNGGDTLVGDAGNDTLIGGAGNDTMNGGNGDDIYSVDATGDIINEGSGAGSGNDTVFASTTFTLGPNIETLILVGTDASNGTGDASANNLIGNDAANTLYGGDGGDGLTGAGGGDTLIGGLGNDGMSGGAGDDLYSVDSVFDVIAEAAGEGLDTVFSETNHVLYLNVELLILVGTGNTQAYGNAQQNFLYGNAGNNYFDSAGQADYMHGGGGSDVYRMRLGELNGDLLGDFASGDLLQFQGYNAATTTVTQLNSFQYRVQDSSSGATEVFGIVSNYTLTAADYTFV